MLDLSHLYKSPRADVQGFYGTTSTPIVVSNLASVTLATGGVLTVPSGTYFVGQVIEVTGTFSAGSITGYSPAGTFYYVITVSSATSITISSTPGGAAVTSTAGTATPGATFNIVTFPQTTWIKPRGVKWVYMLAVGGGSSGAGGTFTGASVATAGAVGGGSGGQSICILPAFLVPDRLYVATGYGGRQDAAITSALVSVPGSSTFITAEPWDDIDAELTFCYANGGAGTTGGTVATIANMPLGARGQYQLLAGQAGGAAGALQNGAGGAVTANAGGLFVTGGAGSGGKDVTAAAGGVGGIITGAGLLETFPSTIAAVTATAAINAGAGAAGRAVTPYMFYGGSGGGGGGFTASGIGSTGGAGGNGHYGCGGGASGPGYLSTGRAGDGGDGFAVIISW